MPLAATRFDLEMFILIEINQTEKDKYMRLFICRIFKKNDRNELIYKTETGSQT